MKEMMISGRIIDQGGKLIEPPTPTLFRTLIDIFSKFKTTLTDLSDPPLSCSCWQRTKASQFLVDLLPV